MAFSQSSANLAQSGYCYARASFLVEQADVLFADNKPEEGVFENLELIAGQSKKRLFELKVESNATEEEALRYIEGLAYRLDDEAQKDKASYSGLGKSVAGDVLTNCQIFVME